MNYDFNNFPLDLVLNLLSIVIMFFLVKLLVYKPTKNFLNARREKIENAEKAASEKAKAADAEKAEYEELIRSSEEEARKAAEAIIKEANARADGIIEEANARAGKVLSLAEEKIRADRAAHLAGAEKETVSLSIDIAEKILGRKMGNSDTINLAQKFFKEATSDKPEK